MDVKVAPMDFANIVETSIKRTEGNDSFGNLKSKSPQEKDKLSFKASYVTKLPRV
jgi:hypothetical protein